MENACTGEEGNDFISIDTIVSKYELFLSNGLGYDELNTFIENFIYQYNSLDECETKLIEIIKKCDNYKCKIFKNKYLLITNIIKQICHTELIPIIYNEILQEKNEEDQSFYLSRDDFKLLESKKESDDNFKKICERVYKKYILVFIKILYYSSNISSNLHNNLINSLSYICILISKYYSFNSPNEKFSELIYRIFWNYFSKNFDIINENSIFLNNEESDISSSSSSGYSELYTENRYIDFESNNSKIADNDKCEFDENKQNEATHDLNVSAEKEHTGERKKKRKKEKKDDLKNESGTNEVNQNVEESVDTSKIQNDEKEKKKKRKKKRKDKQNIENNSNNINSNLNNENDEENKINNSTNIDDKDLQKEQIEAPTSDKASPICSETASIIQGGNNLLPAKKKQRNINKVKSNEENSDINSLKNWDTLIKIDKKNVNNLTTIFNLNNGIVPVEELKENDKIINMNKNKDIHKKIDINNENVMFVNIILNVYINLFNIKKKKKFIFYDDNKIQYKEFLLHNIEIIINQMKNMIIKIRNNLDGSIIYFLRLIFLLILFLNKQAKKYSKNNITDKNNSNNSYNYNNDIDKKSQTHNMVDRKKQENNNNSPSISSLDNTNTNLSNSIGDSHYLTFSKKREMTEESIEQREYFNGNFKSINSASSDIVLNSDDNNTFVKCFDPIYNIGDIKKDFSRKQNNVNPIFGKNNFILNDENSSILENQSISKNNNLNINNNNSRMSNDYSYINLNDRNGDYSDYGNSNKLSNYNGIPNENVLYNNSRDNLYINSRGPYEDSNYNMNEYNNIEKNSPGFNKNIYGRQSVDIMNMSKDRSTNIYHNNSRSFSNAIFGRDTNMSNINRGNGYSRRSTSNLNVSRAGSYFLNNIKNVFQGHNNNNYSPTINQNIDVVNSNSINSHKEDYDAMWNGDDNILNFNYMQNSLKKKSKSETILDLLNDIYGTTNNANNVYRNTYNSFSSNYYDNIHNIVSSNYDNNNNVLEILDTLLKCVENNFNETNILIVNKIFLCMLKSLEFCNESNKYKIYIFIISKIDKFIKIRRYGENNSTLNSYNCYFLLNFILNLFKNNNKKKNIWYILFEIHVNKIRKKNYFKMNSAQYDENINAVDIAYNNMGPNIIGNENARRSNSTMISMIVPPMIKGKQMNLNTPKNEMNMYQNEMSNSIQRGIYNNTARNDSANLAYLENEKDFIEMCDGKNFLLNNIINFLLECCISKGPVIRYTSLKIFYMKTILLIEFLKNKKLNYEEKLLKIYIAKNIYQNFFLCIFNTLKEQDTNIFIYMKFRNLCLNLLYICSKLLSKRFLKEFYDKIICPNLFCIEPFYKNKESELNTKLYLDEEQLKHIYSMFIKNSKDHYLFSYIMLFRNLKNVSLNFKICKNIINVSLEELQVILENLVLKEKNPKKKSGTQTDQSNSTKEKGERKRRVSKNNMNVDEENSNKVIEENNIIFENERKDEIDNSDKLKSFVEMQENTHSKKKKEAHKVECLNVNNIKISDFLYNSILVNKITNDKNIDLKEEIFKNVYFINIFYFIELKKLNCYDNNFIYYVLNSIFCFLNIYVNRFAFCLYFLNDTDEYTNDIDSSVGSFMEDTKINNKNINQNKEPRFSEEFLLEFLPLLKNSLIVISLIEDNLINVNIETILKKKIKGKELTNIKNFKKLVIIELQKFYFVFIKILKIVLVLNKIYGYSLTPFEYFFFKLVQFLDNELIDMHTKCQVLKLIKFFSYKKKFNDTIHSRITHFHSKIKYKKKKIFEHISKRDLKNQEYIEYPTKRPNEQNDQENKNEEDEPNYQNEEREKIMNCVSVKINKGNDNEQIETGENEKKKRRRRNTKLANTNVEKKNVKDEIKVENLKDENILETNEMCNEEKVKNDTDEASTICDNNNGQANREIKKRKNSTKQEDAKEQEQQDGTTPTSNIENVEGDTNNCKDNSINDNMTNEAQDTKMALTDNTEEETRRSRYGRKSGVNSKEKNFSTLVEEENERKKNAKKISAAKGGAKAGGRKRNNNKKILTENNSDIINNEISNEFNNKENIENDQTNNTCEDSQQGNNMSTLIKKIDTVKVKEEDKSRGSTNNKNKNSSLYTIGNSGNGEQEKLIIEKRNNNITHGTTNVNSSPNSNITKDYKLENSFYESIELFLSSIFIFGKSDKLKKTDIFIDNFKKMKELIEFCKMYNIEKGIEKILKYLFYYLSKIKSKKIYIYNMIKLIINSLLYVPISKNSDTPFFFISFCYLFKKASKKHFNQIIIQNFIIICSAYVNILNRIYSNTKRIHNNNNKSFMGTYNIQKQTNKTESKQNKSSLNQVSENYVIKEGSNNNPQNESKVKNASISAMNLTASSTANNDENNNSIKKKGENKNTKKDDHKNCNTENEDNIFDNNNNVEKDNPCDISRNDTSLANESTKKCVGDNENKIINRLNGSKDSKSLKVEQYFYFPSTKSEKKKISDELLLNLINLYINFMCSFYSYYLTLYEDNYIIMKNILIIGINKLLDIKRRENKKLSCYILSFIYILICLLLKVKIKQEFILTLRSCKFSRTKKNRKIKEAKVRQTSRGTYNNNSKSGIKGEDNNKYIDNKNFENKYGTNKNETDETKKLIVKYLINIIDEDKCKNVNLSNSNKLSQNIKNILNKNKFDDLGGYNYFPSQVFYKNKMDRNIEKIFLSKERNKFIITSSLNIKKNLKIVNNIYDNFSYKFLFILLSEPIVSEANNKTMINRDFKNDMESDPNYIKYNLLDYIIYSCFYVIFSKIKLVRIKKINYNIDRNMNTERKNKKSPKDENNNSTKQFQMNSYIYNTKQHSIFQFYLSIEILNLIFLNIKYLPFNSIKLIIDIFINRAVLSLWINDKTNNIAGNKFQNLFYNFFCGVFYLQSSNTFTELPNLLYQYNKTIHFLQLVSYSKIFIKKDMPINSIILDIINHCFPTINDETEQNNSGKPNDEKKVIEIPQRILRSKKEKKL
ncbi:hypothetical protein YYG_01558 [Plasmodium vinckei petteri]|uniref:Uncharacterized protein n=1 Tax=Plasmodium vinckei petteri TaxID=138298 RepID=W7AJ95_PLAVN|nr:hypothetical protein YYG_01558 [Plasmodium vinckei petteri]CAD2109001.1 conserved Plasmodium protein, unknown function [Plasmodium vinckei petteri]